MTFHPDDQAAERHDTERGDTYLREQREDRARDKAPASDVDPLDAALGFIEDAQARLREAARLAREGLRR